MADALVGYLDGKKRDDWDNFKKLIASLINIGQILKLSGPIWPMQFKLVEGFVSLKFI